MQNLEQMFYEGDDNVTTHHFGLKEGNSLIAIASFYLEIPPIHTMLPIKKKTFRLRGMAAANPGKGHGTMLLKTALKKLWAQDAELIWFNARTAAKPFYERLNFVQVGDVFDIPPIGPHVIMWKALTSNEP